MIYIFEVAIIFGLLKKAYTEEGVMVLLASISIASKLIYNFD